jgi:DNA repair protein RecN (Recombination protein N)
MLKQLIISDFAIINHLEIDFRPGLNIMSGETGAGKSIIINAVNLILGGRASADLIRSGAKEARVEALFSLPDNSLISKYLSELDIQSNGELLIKRTISREGRNRILINGSMATLQMLSGIGMMMISISGQHEHQALLKQDNHLFLLDDFGDLTAERMDLAESFSKYEALKEKCLKVEREIKQSKEKQELALFQIKEIETAHILDKEDSLLEEERKRLRHAEQLKEIIAGTYDTLYEKEDSVISELSLCVKGVEKGSEIDRRLESAGNALASAKTELEETALHLRQLRDSVAISPSRLEDVEERLHFLNSLKRKYGPSLEDVMTFREELSGMIHNLDRQEKELEDIKKDLKRQEKDTVSRATALSLKRREVANKKMEKSIEGELAVLEMGGTRFQVKFAPKDPEDIDEPEMLINSIRPEGYDSVEFMLSPNVGEELRPLSKIASGGELSRIMLALKTILARNASVETIIFDEVDSGIGGATAEVIGEKLNSLAEYHQILCITHLPQIASKGDTHFLVTKTVRRNRTETLITALSREQRVKEVGRLMGGKVVSDQAIALAREMLGK